MNDEKYLSLAPPEPLELDVGDLYYDEKEKILFSKMSHGLEPYLIFCDEIVTAEGTEYRGEEIPQDRNNAYYLLCRFARRCGDRFDKTTGQRLNGFLETWQWGSLINFTKAAARVKPADFLQAIARQAGKSHSSRLFIVFCIIFMPMCTYIKESRYYAAWVSPTKTLAKDHMDKMKPYFEEAINLFNEIFPETPLVTKADDRDLQENKDGITIDRITPNGKIPHSQLVVLSADKKSKVPGYTIHLILCDEAQLVDSDYFSVNIAPMTNRTGGITIIQGTSLPDASQLLYSTYRRKSILNKHRIMKDVVEVFLSISLRSREEALLYWERYVKEASDWGVHSDYIQSQYFVSFKIKGDRWLELGELEEIGIPSIEHVGMNYLMETHLRGYNENSKRFYKVGSFDSAKKKDMAAYTGGIIEVVDVDDDGNTEYHSYVTDFRMINEAERKAGTIISPTELTNRIANICIKEQLDMLVYEVSGQQSDRAYYLAKELKKRGCNTKVIPIDYGGRNKQKIFLKVESVIQCGGTSFPTLNNTANDRFFREFIEQVKIFRKEYTGSTVKFAAPDAKGLHDDFISAWVDLIYLPYYCEDCMIKGKTAELDSVQFNYPIRMYKATDEKDRSGRSIMYYR